MYKRHITSIDEYSLDHVQVKKAKNEPLGVITDTFINDSKMNEKCIGVLSKTIDKSENICDEDQMDCENVNNQEHKKDENSHIQSHLQAIKYNSICFGYFANIIFHGQKHLFLNRFMNYHSKIQY